MDYHQYDKALKDSSHARGDMQEEFSRERKLRIALEIEVATLKRQLAKCKCGAKNEYRTEDKS